MSTFQLILFLPGCTLVVLALGIVTVPKAQWRRMIVARKPRRRGQ